MQNYDILLYDLVSHVWWAERVNKSSHVKQGHLSVRLSVSCLVDREDKEVIICKTKTS